MLGQFHISSGNANIANIANMANIKNNKKKIFVFFTKQINVPFYEEIHSHNPGFV